MSVDAMKMKIELPATASFLSGLSELMDAYEVETLSELFVALVDSEVQWLNDIADVEANELPWVEQHKLLMSYFEKLE